MDTKLKGWTAVRIICFTLILALCLTALNRLISVIITYEETNINPNIVLADLSANQHFFEHHADTHTIFHSLDILAQFRSEESIRAGEGLILLDQFDIFRRNSDSDDVWDHEFYQHAFGNIFSVIDLGFAQAVSNEEIDELLSAFEKELFSHSATFGIYEMYPEEFYIVNRRLDLMSHDHRYFYVSIPLSGQTPLNSLQTHISDQIVLNDLQIHIEDAIISQLHMFQSAQEHLDQIEGFMYHIIIDTTPQFVVNPFLRSVSAEPAKTYVVYSNVDENLRYAEYFQSYPVHFIMSGHDFFSASIIDSTFPLNNNIFYNFVGRAELAIAFTHQVVEAQNQIFTTVRNAYIRDFTITAISAILALGLTIVLIVAAGRKYKVVDGEASQTSKVHFIALDKPYLDISLAVLLGLTMLVALFALRLLNGVYHHLNITALNLIALSAILLTVPLALVWLTSFAKRIKAGKFWKHTLIYAIIYNCIFRLLRFIVRTTKSLWAGRILTFKVAVISCAAFFMILVVRTIPFHTVAQVFFTVLLFTAVITVLLLMYARRIHKLKQGALDVAQGNFHTTIEVGGGELGSIADSINNISAGIHKAVEERMKSERLKTELITNVSHDIRTPLTSIITYTDLLEQEGLDCEKAPEYLEILKQKSLRLKTLTEELFEAAKASTGNIDVNLTNLNINSLTSQVLGELDNTIKSSDLDLRVNIPEHLYIRADGRLMQRVMENLINNALKYSMPSSRVYLDARISADNIYALIELKNISATALNFDPAELTERFKRGDDSRTDGGSGLGLSIVQSFINAQNGNFTIEIDGDLFKAVAKLLLANTI